MRHLSGLRSADAAGLNALRSLRTTAGRRVAVHQAVDGELSPGVTLQCTNKPGDHA